MVSGLELCHNRGTVNLRFADWILPGRDGCWNRGHFGPTNIGPLLDSRSPVGLPNAPIEERQRRIRDTYQASCIGDQLRYLAGPTDRPCALRGWLQGNIIIIKPISHLMSLCYSHALFLSISFNRIKKTKALLSFLSILIGFFKVNKLFATRFACKIPAHVLFLR